MKVDIFGPMATTGGQYAIIRVPLAVIERLGWKVNEQVTLTAPPTGGLLLTKE